MKTTPKIHPKDRQLERIFDSGIDLSYLRSDGRYDIARNEQGLTPVRFYGAAILEMGHFCTCEEECGIDEHHIYHNTEGELDRDLSDIEYIASQQFDFTRLGMNIIHLYRCVHEKIQMSIASPSLPEGGSISELNSSAALYVVYANSIKQSKLALKQKDLRLQDVSLRGLIVRLAKAEDYDQEFIDMLHEANLADMVGLGFRRFDFAANKVRSQEEVRSELREFLKDSIGHPDTIASTVDPMTVSTLADIGRIVSGGYYGAQWEMKKRRMQEFGINERAA